jgi:hypothetical protein
MKTANSSLGKLRIGRSSLSRKNWKFGPLPGRLHSRLGLALLVSHWFDDRQNARGGGTVPPSSVNKR